MIDIDPRFLPHNTHRLDPAGFSGSDPHLRMLQNLPFVFSSPLLEALPAGKPGIYSVTGGRQLGKTTLLKQWMHRLIRQGVEPGAITYITGELIDDHHSLVAVLSEILGAPLSGVRYIFIDEITFVRGWERGIKYLADAGLLSEVVLLLTGSDTVLIRDVRMQLPGRRGTSDQGDFHLFPLSFFDVLKLTETLLSGRLDELERGAPLLQDEEKILRRALDRYLLTGGFLTAINDLADSTARDPVIRPATYRIYSDWIRGDVLKRGKQERYLREVISAVIRRLGSQVTWNNLAADLSIDHPATVADYVAVLERMDVIGLIPALVEDKLTGAPKKARKVIVRDPFVLYALRGWLERSTDPFGEIARPALDDPDWKGRLLELCVGAHYLQRFPTFYIKAEGEVDIAYVAGRTFHPVEVKWTGQVRTRDLKQLRKYPNSLLLSQSLSDTISGVANEFLPLHLLRMGPAPYAYDTD